jgi:hypothetical protein
MAAEDAELPLSSGSPPHPPYTVGEYFAENSNTGSFMIRQGEMKLITFGHVFSWFSNATYTPQLFNLTADPYELNDISADNPELVASLTATLEKELGYDLEYIDAVAKANDQFIFRTYVCANKTVAQLQKEFAGTFSGFNETYWNKVVLWNSTDPFAELGKK